MGAPGSWTHRQPHPTSTEQIPALQRRALWPSSETHGSRTHSNGRQDVMTDHQAVSRAEWRAARDELLQREKEQTRMADELARQRRELPWVRVEKEYRFDADDGTPTLAELFDGRSQLLIYHFMFGPSYKAGCPVNSSIADGLNGLLPHLHARDVTLLLVSQAPLARLQAYEQRMGWSIPWVSASHTTFNFDFGGSYTPEQVRGFLPADLDSLP